MKNKIGKIKLPTIMINFKTYNESSGKDALELAKISKEINLKLNKDKKHASISICPQTSDIHSCAQTKVPTLAQHVNIELPGGHTGKTTIKALEENGANGSLINHSENRISFEEIAQTIALLQEAKMTAIVCVKNVSEAKKIAMLNPDAIAIEPPKLIGGDISVTTADPAIIKKSVEAVHKINPEIPVLCGAGVKTGKDVEEAIKLGASGVLIASGVTKAKNKKKAIENLIKGIK